MSGPIFPRSKLLPFWEPLRGDPRFEKIVASLRAKSAEQIARMR
jgi:hypothetical protein